MTWCPRDLAARRRFLSLCLGAPGLWHSLGVDARAGRVTGKPLLAPPSNPSYRP
jgi:hypothetical protein